MRFKSDKPVVRVGIEGRRPAVLEAVRGLRAPVLVSANSLWRQRQGRFQVPASYAGLDVALDSGGFVAMKRYGGYRWSVDQYVALAGEMRPSWWAQMDFCCEPELAGNAREVGARIDRTVEHLHRCQDAAKAAGVPAPMPVLQGWMPRDYTQGPAFESGFSWPTLVGVGSVCRRQVRGHHGLLAVIDAIDRATPDHVRLHLFGVKSGALQECQRRFPGRVASVDSMAWNMAARWDARHAGTPCTNEFRAQAMRQWYLKQQDALTGEEQGLFDL